MTPTEGAGLGALLDARAVTKVFRGGDGGEVRVLEGVDLAVTPGEMVAIVGASGSGKSTLLHVLGALERPTSGFVAIGGEDVSAVDDEALSVIRNRRVGFVFQFHHLLKEFSAVENVMMPLLIAGRAAGSSRERAMQLLDRVGLSARAAHRPSELSGGEQQRTAVARALAMAPSVVLADEPSGNLDHHTAESLHELLAALVRDLGIGLVVVTHNRALAARANRVLLLADGRLADTTGIEGAV
jgi:lipoprotein-releasing system ATP-binding protein